MLFIICVNVFNSNKMLSQFECIWDQSSYIVAQNMKFAFMGFLTGKNIPIFDPSGLLSLTDPGNYLNRYSFCLNSYKSSYVALKHPLCCKL